MKAVIALYRFVKIYKNLKIPLTRGFLCDIICRIAYDVQAVQSLPVKAGEIQKEVQQNGKAERNL
jgi:hypothetical protein